MQWNTWTEHLMTKQKKEKRAMRGEREDGEEGGKISNRPARRRGVVLL
jgi:hypothetical protein